MNEKTEKIKKLMDENSAFRRYSFYKGFLITDAELSPVGEYPFYENYWTDYNIGAYTLRVHNEIKLTTYDGESGSWFIIGHAYNPFTMAYQELDILKAIDKATDKIDELNSLTGVFVIGCVNGSDIKFSLDASGMLWSCYASLDDKLYISSHMSMIGDLFDLPITKYVKRLISYKYYNYMLGNYLPGYITAFDGVKRLPPNMLLQYKDSALSVTRYYPSGALDMAETDEEYGKVIKNAARILQNTLKLISDKFNKPYISLTGGRDSNVTFAAANGVYDKFNAFSYVSMEREKADMEAARKIASRFNVSLDVYNVPGDNDEVQNFNEYKMIIEHLDGDIGTFSDSDIRKKITMKNSGVELEVKSWIGETVRAYAYKYFGLKKLPKKLKPRHWSCMYKIFLGKRKLLKDTDKRFAEYIKETELKENLYNYDESDFFVWEMMHGYKCGLNIGEMKLCFDITISYNNRKLLDLLLRVPFDKRINDNVMIDLIKELNPELSALNIYVKNLNETEKRAKLLRRYFKINSRLPY